MSAPTVLNVNANYYVRGGSDRYFLALESLLATHGCRVVPFSAGDPRNRPSRWSSYFPPGPDVDRPGPTDVLRYVFNPAARRALRDLLAQHPIDVAHLQIYQGRLSSSILQPLAEAGIPIVQTLHDFKPICPAQGLRSGGRDCHACRGRQFWRVLAQRCKRGSFLRSAVSMAEAYTAAAAGFVTAIDHFIAVCNYQRRTLVDLGLPATSISTIHNFVTTEGRRPADEAGSYFLYFGRLAADKGLETLVTAMTRLPGVRLVIAGRGPLEEALLRRVARLRLGNVDFVGFQEDEALWRLVRGATASVLPSVAPELCSLSLLETMSWGRPVIATRVGGTPEIVDHEVHGLLLAAGDVEALTSAIDRLHSDSRAALEMGRRARRRVEIDFGPRRHLEQVLTVYDRLRRSERSTADATTTGQSATGRDSVVTRRIS